MPGGIKARVGVGAEALALPSMQPLNEPASGHHQLSSQAWLPCSFMGPASRKPDG